jgi:predicted NBD/HSP70 family sugar kinase
MCSPQRLLALYKEKSGTEAENLRELDRLYKKEDPAAVFAVAECGKYLGIGLANLVNLFNPSVMVINTGDFEGCPSLLKEAEGELHKRAYRSLTQRLSMKIISETEENTLLGTAFNLCDRLFDISYPKNIVE